MSEKKWCRACCLEQHPESCVDALNERVRELSKKIEAYERVLEALAAGPVYSPHAHNVLAEHCYRTPERQRSEGRSL